MKFFSILSKLILACLVLGALALAAVVLLFDPNDHRDRLAALVRDQTGRELRLQGPLELSLFPWLAVEARDAQLGNAPGFDDRPMLQVERVSAQLRLLPLLSGKIRVGRVELNGLEIHLARDVQGHTNWQDFTALGHDPSGDGRGARTGRDALTRQEEVAEPGSPALDFSLEGVQADKVRLVWEDQQAAQRIVLEDGRLAVGAVRPGAPLDLEADFHFSLTEPELRGRFQLAGALAFDLATQEYACPRLTLALHAEGSVLPGGEVQASLALDQVRADLSKGRASASAFTLLGYGARVSGSLAARNLFEAPAVSGVLELQNTDLRAMLQSIGAEPPQTADPQALASLGSTARFDYADGELRLPYWRVQLGGQSWDGKARVLWEPREYQLTLRGPAVNLDRYLPPLLPESRSGTMGEDLAAKEQAPALTAEPALDEAAEHQTVPGWMQAAQSLTLDLQLNLEGLSVREFALRGLDVAARAKNGVVALEPLQLTLEHGEDVFDLRTGRSFADLHHAAFRVDDLRVKTPAGEVSGSFKLASVPQGQSLGGRLVLNHMNLRRLSTLLDPLVHLPLPETSDPKALTEVHGSLAFEHQPGRTEVRDMDLRVDATRLQGRARMQTMPEVYSAALEVDQLDLDRYLAQDSAGTDASSGSTGTARAEGAGGSVPGAGEAALATSPDSARTLVQRLLDLRADVRLNVGNLRYGGLEFRDIQAVWNAENGLLQLDPLSLGVEQGEVELTWVVDARGARPSGRADLSSADSAAAGSSGPVEAGSAVARPGEASSNAPLEKEAALSLDPGAVRHRFVPEVRGVRLGRLLQRFAGVKQAAGTVHLHSVQPLTWQGIDVHSLKQSLAGSVELAVRDGRYPGLDLFRMLSVVDSLTTAILEGNDAAGTAFGEMTGTIVAKQGRMRCDDLCVKAPGLRAGGEGFVNLPDGRIDYLVRAMAVPDAVGQGGAGCGDYYGVPMPLRVSGTLDDPRYWVSAEEYAASMARGAIGLLGDTAGVVGSVLEGGGNAVQEVLEQVLPGMTGRKRPGATGNAAAENGKDSPSDASASGQRAGDRKSDSPAEQGEKAVQDFIQGLEGLF